MGSERVTLRTTLDDVDELHAPLDRARVPQAVKVSSETLARLLLDHRAMFIRLQGLGLVQEPDVE